MDLLKKNNTTLFLSLFFFLALNSSNVHGKEVKCKFFEQKEIEKRCTQIQEITENDKILLTSLTFSKSKTNVARRYNLNLFQKIQIGKIQNNPVTRSKNFIEKASANFITAQPQIKQENRENYPASKGFTVTYTSHKINIPDPEGGCTDEYELKNHYSNSKTFLNGKMLGSQDIEKFSSEKRVLRFKVVNTVSARVEKQDFELVCDSDGSCSCQLIEVENIHEKTTVEDSKTYRRPRLGFKRVQTGFGGGEARISFEGFSGVSWGWFLGGGSRLETRYNTVIPTTSSKIKQKQLTHPLIQLKKTKLKQKTKTATTSLKLKDNNSYILETKKKPRKCIIKVKDVTRSKNFKCSLKTLKDTKTVLKLFKNQKELQAKIKLIQRNGKPVNSKVKIIHGNREIKTVSTGKDGKKTLSLKPEKIDGKYKAVYHPRYKPFQNSSDTVYWNKFDTSIGYLLLILLLIIGIPKISSITFEKISRGV